MFEDIKWENVKEMRPSLKSDILRSFTPQSAIDYLLADLERKPNDESNLLQQINIYLSKHTTIERFQKGSNALCAVHKLMRKTAVNVVGHYAAAMIVSLHIQELQRRNCEEEWHEFKRLLDIFHLFCSKFLDIFIVNEYA